MKRLLSEEEFRGHLEAAYMTGYVYRGFEGSGLTVPDFEEWYDSMFGGPDCE